MIANPETTGYYWTKFEDESSIPEKWRWVTHQDGLNNGQWGWFHYEESKYISMLNQPFRERVFKWIACEKSDTNPPEGF